MEKCVKREFLSSVEAINISINFQFVSNLYSLFMCIIWRYAFYMHYNIQGVEHLDINQVLVKYINLFDRPLHAGYKRYKPH